MGKKESYISLSVKDLKTIRAILRTICFRGYKYREAYREIGVPSGTYDAILAKTHFLLEDDVVSEDEEVLKERKKGENDNKIIHYFQNDTLNRQDNALAKVWRYAIPSKNDFFFYFAILEILRERTDGVTKQELVKRIEYKIRLDMDIEQKIEEMNENRNNRKQEAEKKRKAKKLQEAGAL